jgi:hypothetical protein
MTVLSGIRRQPTLAIIAAKILTGQNITRGLTSDNTVYLEQPMMKHTQSEREAKAKELYGDGWEVLPAGMRQSWLRSADYRLRMQDIENAVDNAVENEATTKGWLMAHQGAWDMAGFYAEEAGVSIDGFRKNMLKRHRGQFTKEAK